MYTWKHLSASRLLSLLVILTAILLLVPQGTIYAKGVRNSDNSDNARSSREDRNSRTNDQRSESSRKDERSAPSRSATEQMRTPRPNGPDRKSPITSTNTEKRAESDHRYYPQQNRTDMNSARTPSQGSTRRDYSNLGQMWKQRSEYRNHDSNSRAYTYPHYIIPPGRIVSPRPKYYSVPRTYRYYEYDYRPGYSIPSVYCLYSGYYPPYVPSSRIIIINSPYISYTYIDIPRTVISYNYAMPSAYDDYNSPYSNLSIALQDIRRAWETGEADSIIKHVSRSNNVDILLSGEYLYSLDWNDYRDMTEDAITAVDTVQFNFYRVQQRNDGKIVAYAKHIYRDMETDSDSDYDATNTVYIALTLSRQGNDWYITAVNTSSKQF